MTNLLQSERNPWLSLLIIVLLAFGTAIIAPLIYSYLVGFIVGTDYKSMMSAFSSPNLFPELKTPLLIVQLLTSFTSFVLVPLYFVKRYEAGQYNKYVQFDNLKPIAFVTTTALVMAFMIVNSVFIEWNMNVEFPESIAALAREMEDKGKVLTEYFTDFHSIPYFLLSLLVIAVVPAIGEELLFRGVIQRQIHRITRNPHLAIWLAAIFFSAFHFQFFGFVPRMFLGALFGYLFIYSGNLIYPILAHFVNNGFTLTMLFLHQRGLVSFDIENTETVPLESVLIFTIIGAGLFAIFYRQMNIQVQSINE
jgi:membrane protease YdiL (CAAX protease family)